jgi:hypothetical protein
LAEKKPLGFDAAYEELRKKDPSLPPKPVWDFLNWRRSEGADWQYEPDTPQSKKDQSRLPGGDPRLWNRLPDSPEFSPMNLAPLGIPGNPLEGTPNGEIMGHDLSAPPLRDRFGMKAPLVMPGRMESAGMTGIGGVPSATQLPQYPEQLLVPDVVSATDPAFAAHPAVQSYLRGLSKTPAASSIDSRDALPSAWMQFRSGDRGKKLSKADLINGLNMGTYGMDLPYQEQGNSTLIR